MKRVNVKGGHMKKFPSNKKTEVEGMRDKTIKVELAEAAFLYLNGNGAIVLDCGDGASHWVVGGSEDGAAGDSLEIVLPENATKIGELTIQPHFTASIHVHPANPSYCDVDGVLFNKDKTELIKYPRKNQTSYTVPDSVAVIGDRAFERDENLKNIVLPESLVEIGEEAFIHCTALEEVTIPKNAKKIGAEAFAYCESLKKHDVWRRKYGKSVYN